MRSRAVKQIFASFTLAAAIIGAAMAAQKHVIEQKDRSFSTAELEVRAGDTIVFRNDDDVAHNAFSKSAGNEFNSKLQAPGASSEVTLKTVGIVEVRCAIHPGMKLRIHVK